MADPVLASIGTLTGDGVITVDPSASLLEAAQTLVGNDVGLVAVGTAGRISGVVSERDVVRALVDGRDLAATKVTDVASTNLVWADASATIRSVAAECLTAGCATFSWRATARSSVSSRRATCWVPTRWGRSRGGSIGDGWDVGERTQRPRGHTAGRHAGGLE